MSCFVFSRCGKWVSSIYHICFMPVAFMISRRRSSHATHYLTHTHLAHGLRQAHRSQLICNVVVCFCETPGVRQFTFGNVGAHFGLVGLFVARPLPFDLASVDIASSVCLFYDYIGPLGPSQVANCGLQSCARSFHIFLFCTIRSAHCVVHSASCVFWFVGVWAFGFGHMFALTAG